MGWSKPTRGIFFLHLFHHAKAIGGDTNILFILRNNEPSTSFFLLTYERENETTLHKSNQHSREQKAYRRGVSYSVEFYLHI
jgi:hypothetical protein